MPLNIRYEGSSVWNGYISPDYDFENEEFVENMNEKIAELKEWAEKNLDSDNFNDEFFEKRLELGEWISEQDLEIECDFSHHETEGEIIVNDEELEMDDEEIKEFYYKGAEESYEPKEDWYISREYSTQLTLEFESEDDFDKSKLKWNKDGEGGLDYENEDDECFEDVSGGESNGDETRIWKIKVQGIDYFGHW